jgi:arylsulfatase A
MYIKISLPVMAIGITAGFCSSCENETQKPNVIIFFADDLGWPQTGAYGSNYYNTPNIDRLSDEGVRFTDAYSAAAICSPTRASLMTGKYPARLRITDFIPGSRRNDYRLTAPEMQQYLPVEEFTLGNLFKEEGYITAMFGKWHLSITKFGPESLPFNPDKQGFDQHFVIDKPDRTFDPEHDPHSSDSIGDTSVRFIRENAGKPFFLLMSFSAIHDPLIERADSINMWSDRDGSEKPENNPIIAAILSRMDRNIGKVLDVVDELGLAENTIVVFYSDNGGLAENNVVYYSPGEEMKIAWQTPLRKGKGWLYEGGIRVPLVVRWPGVAERGLVSREIITSCDFMPTFCELFGREPEPGVDGMSFLSHLRSGEPLPARNLYWHYPHYHNQSGMVPGAAIRSGRWKLIEWYEKSILENGVSAFELYDLEEDIGEMSDLSGIEKEITRKLSGDLDQWRKEVRAQMPVPNPDYR